MAHASCPARLGPQAHSAAPDARAAAEGWNRRTAECLLLSSSAAKPVAQDSIGSRNPPSGRLTVSSRALRIAAAQWPRPADGACGEAACSPTTSCRTRRLQCLDPLLVRSLHQLRTLDGGRRARSFLGGVFSASMYASTRWRCGRRGSVLPNVALRIVRVSVLLVLFTVCPHFPSLRLLHCVLGRSL